MKETHLLEALLQCNNYPQRRVPLVSVNTTIERGRETLPEDDSEKQQPHVAVPELPSGETSLPAVERIGKVLAYIPE